MIKRAQDVFDVNAKKLFVYVLEGKELMAKNSDGTSDPYVRLTMGKLPELRTTVQKKNLNPKWEELFFYDQVPGEPLVLSVYDHHSLGADEFMGQCSLDRLDALPADEVVEQWYELAVRSDRKKKDKAVSGRLLVRLYYSDERETRPSPPPENSFFYADYLPQFKTGDLIAYNETGVLAALMKLTNGAMNGVNNANNNNSISGNNSNNYNSPLCRFSRFGMVLELPNRWNERYELFVVEPTRNIDALIDVFDDSTAEGVRIFRLRERLHQIHAHSVYWLPLKQPLDQQTGQMMVEWIWDVHGGRQRFTEAPTAARTAAATDPLPLRMLFREWKPQARLSVLDLYSVEFIFRALRLAHRVTEITALPAMSASALLAALECVAAPVLLRERKFRRPYVLPTGRAHAGTIPSDSSLVRGSSTSDIRLSNGTTPTTTSSSSTANTLPSNTSIPSSGTASPLSANTPPQSSPLVAVVAAQQPPMPPQQLQQQQLIQQLQFQQQQQQQSQLQQQQQPPPPQQATSAPLLQPQFMYKAPPPAYNFAGAAALPPRPPPSSATPPPTYAQVQQQQQQQQQLQRQQPQQPPQQQSTPPPMMYGGFVPAFAFPLPPPYQSVSHADPPPAASNTPPLPPSNTPLLPPSTAPTTTTTGARTSSPGKSAVATPRSAAAAAGGANASSAPMAAPLNNNRRNSASGQPPIAAYSPPPHSQPPPPYSAVGRAPSHSSASLIRAVHQPPPAYVYAPPPFVSPGHGHALSISPGPTAPPPAVASSIGAAPSNGHAAAPLPPPPAQAPPPPPPPAAGAPHATSANAAAVGAGGGPHVPLSAQQQQQKMLAQQAMLMRAKTVNDIGPGSSNSSNNNMAHNPFI